MSDLRVSSFERYEVFRMAITCCSGSCSSLLVEGDEQSDRPTVKQVYNVAMNVMRNILELVINTTDRYAMK